MRHLYKCFEGGVPELRLAGARPLCPGTQQQRIPESSVFKSLSCLPSPDLPEDTGLCLTSLSLAPGSSAEEAAEDC